MGILIERKTVADLLNPYVVFASFLVSTLWFFIAHIQLIKDVVVHYSELKLLPYILFTFLLAGLVIRFNPLGTESSFIVIVGGLLWILGGLFRTYVHKSRALFELPMNSFLKLCKGWGYARLSFYLYCFLMIPNLVSRVFLVSGLLLDSIYVVGMVSMLKNNMLPLYPYVTESATIKDAVLIIRYLGENPKSPSGRIASSVGKSQEHIQENLGALSRNRFIEKTGRFYSLQKEYRNLKEKRHFFDWS